MEACLPDVRVAPVKVTAVSQQQAGYASPRRKIGGGSDAGPLYRSLKGLSRSKSARDPAEEVYEEFGSPVERAVSRPSSRVKSRVAKDARAELLGLDEAHMHNVGHNRGLRSRSAARVREGVVDVEMDVDLCENHVASSHNDIIVTKARPPSRSRNRSLREDNGDNLTLQEALQQAAERDREVRASRTTKGGVDVPVEIDVRSYGGRSVGSTPRLSTRASTPRLTDRGSLRDREDLGGGLLDVECEKELRSSSVDAARRSLVPMDSMEDDVMVGGQVERVVSYRTPTRSPRGVRESTDHLAEEKLMSAERLTRKQQLRSPRKTKMEIVADMQVDAVMVQSERVYSRRNVRKAEVDGPAADDDDDDDVVQVNQRKSRVARQHKRKVREIPRDSATALPVNSCPPESEMPDVPPVEPVDPLPPSPTTSARSGREANASKGVGWLHVIGDLIMWKDVPRSALWFGAGSFGILSASFMQEMQSGIVAISANLALFYLAMVFFYRTFLRGSVVQSISGNVDSCQVTESDLLGWIRLILPAVNLALKKASEVFSGDPATTLKVAAVLLFFAKVGSGISIWSFIRFGFFALFTIPKCHSCYSTQLYAYAQALLVRGLASWSGFAHKKAMLVGVFLLGWNMSSFTSRLWGGFMLIVWLKLYQQSHPASFEKALSDASCGSAMDRIDRRKSLHQAMVAPAAASLPVGTPSIKDSKVQSFPDRKSSGVTYRA